MEPLPDGHLYQTLLSFLDRDPYVKREPARPPPSTLGRRFLLSSPCHQRQPHLHHRLPWKHSTPAIPLSSPIIKQEAPSRANRCSARSWRRARGLGDGPRGMVRPIPNREVEQWVEEEGSELEKSDGPRGGVRKESVGGWDRGLMTAFALIFT